MKEKIVSMVTIHDLKELEYGESELTPQHRLAIKNFDRYRFKTLTSAKSESKFHQEFQRLQVLANLNNFEEFLKEEYC
jgi:hypothetical protein